MQSSSEQPLVGEERYVTTLITAAKETTRIQALSSFDQTLIITAHRWPDCAPGCDAGGRDFDTPTGPTLSVFK